ncbi:MAG: response regulator transcription factor [Rhodocyclales bacterium]|nr:response regulator transcription factor [Rhodocyclales bacterium]MDB5887267.1 response regulator transcription factor [Rhodocyclales bacterium]
MTIADSVHDICHIAIVDDDPGVRYSLGMIMETCNWRFTSFEHASDFLERANAADFNCLLIDVRMTGMSGLELFEELNRRTREACGYLPPVLFLSGHGDIPMVVHALKQGALNFLEKPVEHRALLDAIGKARQADCAARHAHESRAELLGIIAELTTRQREVLAKILCGYLNKQIAGRLNVSTKTVEAHRLRICQKFNVRTGMELAAKLRDIPPGLWQEADTQSVGDDD